MFEPSLFSDDLEHVLCHTRDLWAEVRGERLFVTGGTGFFGMWLIESFLWANAKLNLGAEVVVLSRDPAAFLRKMPQLAGQPALSLWAGSMDSFAFPGGPFAAVVHAATGSHTSSSYADRLAAFDRDIEGTRHALHFALHCGAKRFLLTSSGAVYGRQPAEMPRIPDDYTGSPDTMDANSGYGQAKRVSEFLCGLYAKGHGLETKIARCFAFVGPYLRLNVNFAVGNFIRDALSGGPIRIEGDGTPYRSYLYAADLAVWLWTLLFRGVSGRTYNVGSDEPVTIAELARAVVAAVAPGVEVRIAKTPQAGQPPWRYVPATQRARDELGLEVKIGLPDALGRTAAWHARRVPPAIGAT